MTRLPDPTDLPEDVREYLADFPPDPMVRMMAHSVATVRLFIQQAMIQFTDLRLSARRRELATLTVAACIDCAFIAAEHTPMSAKAGVSDSVRDIISRKDFDNPALDPQDRAFLKFAAEVVERPRVSDEVFAAAREFLSDREIVELIQVCGYYWSFGRIATTLDVPIPAVSDGA
jgi:alkylhydroperoxidase family enzyme